MRERLSGRGKLTRLSEPGIALPVTFDFQIERTIKHRPGLPIATGPITGRGSVIPVEGTATTSEDFYELVTDDGQKFRVQLLGGVWHLLSPMP